LIDNKENRIFKDDNNQISLTTFNEKIILKDVSFSYEDTTKEVFQKFNLEINKGEKLIIMRKSGLGKSTLIDIILGLLKPKSGQIIIDKNDLSNKI
jgi:ATP-binding cassette, subfamily B, bacterial PglK